MNIRTNVTPLAWLITGCLALAACQQTADTSTSSQSLENSERSAADPSASDDADPPPPPHGHHHRGPPPEAISACADLAVEASCSVTLPGPDGERTIDGTCRSMPAPPDTAADSANDSAAADSAADHAAVVACVPTDMPPPRHHRGPPQEAFDACASLEADAACSVTLPGPDGEHTIEGTCRTARDSDTLLCHPPGPPPGPPPGAPDGDAEE